MGDGTINVVTLFVEDYIREIIIFIYDKVEPITLQACFGIQHVQFVDTLFSSKKAGDKLIIVFLIAFQENVQLHATVIIKAL